MVEELRRTTAKEFNGEISSRAAALSLFGMMNWIYTWHNPRRDPSATELADMMADIFLRGLLGQAHPVSPKAGGTRVGQPSSKPSSVGSAAGQKSSGRAARSASSTI